MDRAWNHPCILKLTFSFCKDELPGQRVDRNPTDNELRFELGSRLFKAGQYRDAIHHLQMAKRSPNLRIRVMNQLGQCYERMGMTDLAAGQFKEAIGEFTGMDDTKKELVYNVALLYETLGNHAVAGVGDGARRLGVGEGTSNSIF